jgi:hypothetical protein
MLLKNFAACVISGPFGDESAVKFDGYCRKVAERLAIDYFAAVIAAPNR